MNKHETKFANTAKRLQKALLSLLEEKEFLDISISDICARAKINRSTFYAHYHNTMELVAELECSLFSEFEKENADLMTSRMCRSRSVHEENLLMGEEVLSVYLNFVKKYRHVYVVYNNCPAFNKKAHEQILKEAIFLPDFKVNGIYDAIMEDYLFTYYLSGINSIISKWVTDDCKVPIKMICRIIQACIGRRAG